MGMLKYLDKVENKVIDNRIPAMIRHIGYNPTVTIGDKRDRFHMGMLTDDHKYIAMFHMVEYGLDNYGSLSQCHAILDFIADMVLRVQQRSWATKGSHHGILGNVTMGIPVRQFHCKFAMTFHYAGENNGMLAFWQYSDSRRTLHYVTSHGKVFSYTSQPINS